MPIQTERKQQRKAFRKSYGKAYRTWQKGGGEGEFKYKPKAGARVLGKKGFGRYAGKVAEKLTAKKEYKTGYKKAYRKFAKKGIKAGKFDPGTFSYAGTPPATKRPIDMAAWRGRYTPKAKAKFTPKAKLPGKPPTIPLSQQRRTRGRPTGQIWDWANRRNRRQY